MAVSTEIREQAKKDFLSGLKYKEIAQKYNVSLSTVKSWATRHWKNQKVATNIRKKEQKKKKLQKVATELNLAKHPGGQKGNKNALKHGAYASVFWETMSEKERILIDECSDDVEELLLNEIQLFTVREYRILNAIALHKIENTSKPSENLVIDSIISFEDQRVFKNQQEKNKYEEINREKIQNGKKLPGTTRNVQSVMVSKTTVLLRLEKELTSVQSKKQKAIDSLAKYRYERNNASNSDDKMKLANEWADMLLLGGE